MIGEKKTKVYKMCLIYEAHQGAPSAYFWDMIDYEKERDRIIAHQSNDWIQIIDDTIEREVWIRTERLIAIELYIDWYTDPNLRAINLKPEIEE